MRLYRKGVLIIVHLFPLKHLSFTAAFCQQRNALTFFNAVAGDQLEVENGSIVITPAHGRDGLKQQSRCMLPEMTSCQLATMQPILTKKNGHGRKHVVWELKIFILTKSRFITVLGMSVNCRLYVQYHSNVGVAVLYLFIICCWFVHWRRIRRMRAFCRQMKKIYFTYKI